MLFTWNNGQMGNGLIGESLDGVVCSTNQLMQFPKVMISHILSTNLDYLTLVLNTMFDKDKRFGPFWFISTQHSNETFKNVFGEAQEDDVRRSYTFQLMNKLKLIKKGFRSRTRTILISIK